MVGFGKPSALHSTAISSSVLTLISSGSFTQNGGTVFEIFFDELKFET
jgi:hypothetical protein